MFLLHYAIDQCNYVCSNFLRPPRDSMNKILLMSHCVPPTVRGPSVIISRLFSYFLSNSYGILTSQFERKGIHIDNDLRLSCKYYYVNIEPTAFGYKRTYYNILKKWLEVIPIVIKGLNVIKKGGFDKLVVCPTHGNFFLAAYLMHKICKKRLYVYYFDLFIINQRKPGFETFMRLLTERLALRSVECAFVMSEKLKDYYQARYPNLKIKIIRHSIDKRKYLSCNENINKNGNSNMGPKKIVFTGMIYEYQIDAIRNLARAVNELNDVEFHIYTQRSKESLESMGVSGKNIVYCGYVTERELVRIQKDADILFLPISFHGPGTNADVIKTASPSKIAEYLAAGKPILVHAPEDAYITWYARKYEFGLVVDKPDLMALRKAITELGTNRQLREKLVSNSGKVSRMHDVSKVSRYLMEELGIVGTSSGI